MSETNINAFKKPFSLAATGIALQMIGSACLILASVITMKQTNDRVKQLLTQKLSK